jgi:hypothetical protein
LAIVRPNIFSDLYQDDKILFQELKLKIAAVMMESYPGINPDISKWKGQEISDFQEELSAKVSGRISEKWFYTHIKSESKNIPRIDILNILSQYAGYQNWDHFRLNNSGPLSLVRPARRDYLTIKILSSFIATILLLFVLFKLINTQTYRFGFIDADSGDPVVSDKIQAEILEKDESPRSYIADQDGIISIRTDQSLIKMVVKAPDFFPDTLTRVLKKFNRSEKIRLRMDSYSLMVKYFLQTDVAGWKNRRSQLNRIISDDAMIFQYSGTDGRSGIALYNKQEFIDMVTMPSSTLGKMNIIDSKYEHGKIVLLRFRINGQTE